MKLPIYFNERFPVPDLAGHTRTLEPDSKPVGHIFLMGRHTESDVQVRHKMVSLRHCAFRFNPPGLFGQEPYWEICDFGSHNGTYFNGRKLEPHNWEPIQIDDKFFLVGPDFTCIIATEDDTLQAEEETIIQATSVPEPTVQTVVAPPPAPRPYTYGDAVYEVAHWVTRASTPVGAAFRFSMAALAAAIVVVVVSLIL